jgi:hypothetical protein
LLPDITAKDLKPDWDAIARDYAAGPLTVLQVCEAHAVSQTALYYRAKAEGWPLRRAPDVLALRRSRAGLTKRLLSALDAKLAQLEHRMANSTASETAADGERDARTLHTLLRMLERLREMGEAPGGKRRGRPPQAAAGTMMDIEPHDAERIRNDLAQRLEALRGQLGG